MAGDEMQSSAGGLQATDLGSSSIVRAQWIKAKAALIASGARWAVRAPVLCDREGRPRVLKKQEENSTLLLWSETHTHTNYTHSLLNEHKMKINQQM